MRENTLEVLFYLFDNFSDLEYTSKQENTPDKSSLYAHLHNAGFLDGEIIKAFDWLESLNYDRQVFIQNSQHNSMRIYTDQERCWFTLEFQAYLHNLEETAVINAEVREQVIQQVVSLEDETFDLDKLKWVILMVLLNRPEEEAASVWMDDVAMNGEPPVYH